MDKLAASNQPRTSDSSEYFPSHSFIRASEINLPQKNTKVNSDLSCPNLLLSQKGPQYSSKCQTLFKNRQMFSATAIVEIERPLKSEISKLRAELLRIQSNTLKEQGDLSRRLEGIIKEKRELSKQVCTLLKENKAAKAQLEELGAEKTTLQKRLEFASKEFKANTKTKKVALAKLQEISSQVEDLKKQLERMGRDKEILEGKLEVLRHEYDNLKERFHLYQISVSSHQQVSEKTTAEKPSVEDEKGNTSEDPELARENSKASVLNHSAESDLHLNSNLSKDTIYLPYVISQTEMDMKKIQRKIFALEKNLESFNSSKSDFDKKNSELLAEMDLQTSNRKLAENIIKRSMPNVVTCRKKYEDIKIQMLTNALKDKVKILENIKDKGDESRFSLDDKFEESSSEEAKLEDPLTPGRIVSTSTAFQNFLKTITPS